MTQTSLVDSRGASGLAAAGLPGSMLRLTASDLAGDAWPRLLATAQAEGLTGILLAASDSSDVELSRDQREELGRTHEEAMTQSLLLERLLVEVAERLAVESVELRVLKGSAVAHLDYPTASMRPFNDVDLLVRPDDVQHAIAILAGMGFTRPQAQTHPGFDRAFGKGATLVGPTGMEIDLHRTFVMGGFGLAVDLEQVWSRPQHYPLAGLRLPALSAEARIMHAAYHAVVGNWPPRLLPYRDLAEMLLYGGYSDATLRELAAGWRAEIVLATAVQETWDLLNIADVTALSAWAARFQPTRQERELLAVHRSPDSSYAAQSRAAVRMIPGWSDRLTYLRWLAVPSREFLDSRGTNLRAHLWRGLRRAARW